MRYARPARRSRPALRCHELVVTVVLDFGALGQRSLEHFARHGGNQRLPPECKTHDTSSQRLRQAFDFERLGAVRDVVRRVVEQLDRADVNADPRFERKVAKRIVIGDGEARSIDRAIEQQEETVGAGNLAASVAPE